MRLYCKRQSAFRPVALGISGIATVTTLYVIVQAIGWANPGWRYIIGGVVLWVLYSTLIYQVLGPANGFLIRQFGAVELEKQQRLLALEIVVALFDRKPSLDVPDDEDLVKREAALSFSEVFFPEDNHGS